VTTLKNVEELIFLPISLCFENQEYRDILKTDIPPEVASIETSCLSVRETAKIANVRQATDW
jgi:hypothetical protein